MIRAADLNSPHSRNNYQTLQVGHHPCPAADESAYIKFTNAHCESFNKSWVINRCRLRAIKRDVTALNINISVLHPADDIKLSITYLKKANGFKPFVLNSTLDACEYFHKKDNPIANLVFPFLVSFSNFNHTYLLNLQGDQIVKNFYPKNEIVRLIHLMGDYLVMLSWILSKRKTFVTNVYFTFNG
ncbi:PREDICTED: uncharacterized protein LOC108978117 [Bactrocera latifrons]|uniref:uncharacterized protein LOC108978117 n=1 Tax=Bactrocera latifrons TaxID=174628 RepID=UPI0008DDD401|nr:PREDICTED: uncharacterized protein LOC108978117 [Bactrocera latifrons]